MVNALNRICQPVTDERDTDGGRVLVDFTGRVISHVSDGYALVQTRDVVAPFVERFGIENVKKVRVQGQRQGYGGRVQNFAHVAIETGRTFAFKYNGQEDVIRERLIIENSYNKTRSFRFMFGAFRSVCANGLYTGQAVAAIRRAHVGRIDVPGLVSDVMASWENQSFDLWRDFQASPMTLEEEKALAASFAPFDPGTDEAPNLTARRTNAAIQRRALAAVGRDESLDNQRNAWGLLNGLNFAIAKELRTPSALPRVIAANVAAERMLADVLKK
jgi:hypothetical protein